jgi:hypothetical protein
MVKTMENWEEEEVEEEVEEPLLQAVEFTRMRRPAVHVVSVNISLE